MASYFVLILFVYYSPCFMCQSDLRKSIKFYSIHKKRRRHDNASCVPSGLASSRGVVLAHKLRFIFERDTRERVGRLTMPPKTKNKKAVKTVVDGLSPEEMSKDQLEEHIVRLREELDREREERSFFQLERDKIQASWEISKRRLEEEKGELRNRQREREEAEARHQVEITEYKQKLKHVLSEHHDELFGLKADGVASAGLVEKQHTQSEIGLRRDLHALQADYREKKLHNDNSIKELQLKHQVELMELEKNYEKRFTELQVTHHKKRQLMVDTETKKRQDAVSQITCRMQKRVDSLTEEHDAVLKHKADYYSTLQKKLQQDQDKLKGEQAQARKLQLKKDRELSAAQQKNQVLKTSLQEAQQKLPELQKLLQEHKEAKSKMVASKARVKVLDQELRDLSLQHQLLQCGFEKVERERDEVLEKQTEAIQEVRQRSSLKHLLLEKKLAALTAAAEKQEAQLFAALAASDVEPSAGARAADKLQEMLKSKQATIDALQGDLARDCQEYDELLQTCKEKLHDLGVPLYDFPFRPSERTLGGRDSLGPPSKERTRPGGAAPDLSIT
uniref:Dynein regulatory complex subunit 4 n=1 Tax=Gasterosteus aculeatus aculeatus TaxID=481459 RepID=G3NAB0_GASAC